MKKYTITLLAIVAFSVFCNAQLKIDRAHYVKLFNEGKYMQVLKEAMAQRKEQYGKDWTLDYLIAKAQCALGDYNRSQLAFQYALDYSLSLKQKTFLKSEMAECKSANNIDIDKLRSKLIANLGENNTVPSAISIGKMGYVLNCNTDPEAFQFDPSFDQGEFDNRLFEKTKSAKAVAYYKKLLGDDYQINASQQFIFISLGTHDVSDELKNTQTELEKVYNFYSSFYGIAAPNKFVIVYLMENKENLQSMAKKVHGLTIPKSNIGYSCLADLSVLGTADKKNLGTILHELFHVMVRTEIGDIPGWLDEGIATLYEESEGDSSWVGGQLMGSKKPWRTIVLKLNNQSHHPLPTLRTIIQNNWSEFTPSDATSLCEVANNYAMVRHFAIYLQEKKWLQKLVTSYKNRRNSQNDLTILANKTPIEVFEDAIGLPIDNVQLSFNQWMSDNYQINIDAHVAAYDVRDQLERGYDSLYPSSCRTDSEYPMIEKEHHAVVYELQKLNDKKIPDELLKRSTRLLDRISELLLKCSGH